MNQVRFHQPMLVKARARTDLHAVRLNKERLFQAQFLKSTSTRLQRRTMKQLLILTLTFSNALFALAADQDTSFKPGVASHEGVWKPASAILGGAKLPQPSLEAITLKISGINYEVTIVGEQTDKGTCKLDQTTLPMRMTIIGTNGPNLGRTIPAIYEMKDAQSLRICYDLSGKEFPKAFAAPKGTKLYLVDYRRVTAPRPEVPEHK
jgi:uncharacterized protein (TIGR03067 family)